MSSVAEQLLENALHLPPGERATLAEEILASLDSPDPRIDDLWIGEAKARFAAYKAGQMEAVSLEEVFAESDLPCTTSL